VLCCVVLYLQHRKLPTVVHFPMQEERLEMTKYLVSSGSRVPYSYRLCEYSSAAHLAIRI
jgi:hypothetical protein